jgi:hypothetical protein
MEGAIFKKNCNTRKNLNFVIIAFDYVILCFAIYAFWCDFFMFKVLRIGFFLLQSKNLFFFIVFVLGPELEID